MTVEERQHLDMATYQKNRRHMCWAAFAMMLACTLATLIDPTRMEAAESILMAQYLALSGLVATYFAVGSKEKWVMNA